MSKKNEFKKSLKQSMEKNRNISDKFANVDAFFNEVDNPKQDFRTPIVPLEPKQPEPIKEVIQEVEEEFTETILPSPTPKKNSVKAKVNTSPTRKEMFSIPEEDYILIDKTRKRLAGSSDVYNKSEIVRIALHLLDSISTKEIEQVAVKLNRIRPGAKKK